MDRAAQIQNVLQIVSVALLALIIIVVAVRLGWAAYLSHVDRHIERKRAAQSRADKDHDFYG